jgi:threonine dehydrogenase-like Zn-dependent dehydrogenase
MSLLNNVLFREPQLVASVGASGGFAADGRPAVYARALSLIESGRINVASIITHRYTQLGQVPQALADDWRAADYVKGVVTL